MNIIFNSQSRLIQNYKSVVNSINLLENEISQLTNKELIIETNNLKLEYREKNELSWNHVCKSFAIVKEASYRTIGLKHYDVQLMGGIILHEGKIAEMKTGEGKTLVSTLPAYTNALTSKGVHIITVNNYLAKRDKDWMGQVHSALGLTVGLVQNNMDLKTKKKNYSCDITYLTNSDVGFDYLNDNLAEYPSEIVQRPFNYCIVDEVDSILIDESGTPLIIGRENQVSTEEFIRSNFFIKYLKRNKHFFVDEKNQNIILTSQGVFVLKKLITSVNGPQNLLESYLPYVINALKAKYLYIKNINYVVQNNEVIIVDESTGRTMEGRRWSKGLHQAVETKENILIRKNNETIASITYQSLFLLYEKLSGMTGTAKTDEAELQKIYNLEVVTLPTYKPIQRKDLPEVMFLNERVKWKSVAQECLKMYKIGRPVLVGTTSIQKSELLSTLLSSYNVPHSLLNAKPENARKESLTIAKAGCKGAITIATNMAGRGTDILLGGDPNFKAKQKIYLLISKLSIENKKNFNEEKFNALLITEVIHPSIREHIYEIGKISFSIYDLYEEIDLINLPFKNVTELGKKLSKLYKYFLKEAKNEVSVETKKVRDLGGLYVIGTELHDSQRIDNQLKGRSGRQGDVGTSRFFLSVDDRIPRIFGSKKIVTLLSSIGVDSSIQIESKNISKQLTSAQEKIQLCNYGIRKNIFEYDKVIDFQRQMLYKERMTLVQTQNLFEWVVQFGEKVVNDVFIHLNNIEKSFITNQDYNSINSRNSIETSFSLKLNFKSNDNKKFEINDFKKFFYEQVWIAYELRAFELEVYCDGLSTSLIKKIFLNSIDNRWKNHLQKAEALKEVTDWSGLSRKDPLTEYQISIFELYLDMLIEIRHEIITNLLNLKVNNFYKLS